MTSRPIVDALVKRGREIFRHEIAAGFPLLREVKSPSALRSLFVLNAASEPTLKLWSELLPECGVLLSWVDWDRPPSVTHSPGRRSYLSALNSAPKTDWPLHHRSATLKRKIKMLREDLHVAFKEIAIGLEVLDPTTLIGEKTFRSITVKIAVTISSGCMSYGQDIYVNGRQVLANMHLLSWMGLNTTEWMLSDTSNPALISATVAKHVSLLTNTIAVYDRS